MEAVEFDVESTAARAPATYVYEGPLFYTSRYNSENRNRITPNFGLLLCDSGIFGVPQSRAPRNARLKTPAIAYLAGDGRSAVPE